MSPFPYSSFLKSILPLFQHDEPASLCCFLQAGVPDKWHTVKRGSSSGSDACWLLLWSPSSWQRRQSTAYFLHYCSLLSPWKSWPSQPLLQSTTSLFCSLNGPSLLTPYSHFHPIQRPKMGRRTPLIMPSHNLQCVFGKGPARWVQLFQGCNHPTATDPWTCLHIWPHWLIAVWTHTHSLHLKQTIWKGRRKNKAKEGCKNKW